MMLQLSCNPTKAAESEQIRKYRNLLYSLSEPEAFKILRHQSLTGNIRHYPEEKPLIPFKIAKMHVYQLSVDHSSGIFWNY